MAWHKKGLDKEDRARADLIVAQALLDIVVLDKGNMKSEDAFKILSSALDLTISSVSVLEKGTNDIRKDETVLE